MKIGDGADIAARTWRGVCWRTRDNIRRHVLVEGKLRQHPASALAKAPAHALTSCASVSAGSNPRCVSDDSMSWLPLKSATAVRAGACRRRIGDVGRRRKYRLANLQRQGFERHGFMPHQLALDPVSWPWQVEISSLVTPPASWSQHHFHLFVERSLPLRVMVVLLPTKRHAGT